MAFDVGSPGCTLPLSLELASHISFLIGLVLGIVKEDMVSNRDFEKQCNFLVRVCLYANIINDALSKVLKSHRDSGPLWVCFEHLRALHLRPSNII